MSFLSKIVGGAAAAPIEAIGGALDGLFTSDEERLDKKVLLERLRQKPALAQVALNTAEAGHRTIFVAGWRPYIGWVCGTAIAYEFLFRHLIAWGVGIYAQVSGIPIEAPPEVATEALLELVLAMLGMAGLRSIEKAKGVTK